MTTNNTTSNSATQNNTQSPAQVAWARLTPEAQRDIINDTNQFIADVFEGDGDASGRAEEAAKRAEKHARQASRDAASWIANWCWPQIDEFDDTEIEKARNAAREAESAAEDTEEARDAAEKMGRYLLMLTGHDNEYQVEPCRKNAEKARKAATRARAAADRAASIYAWFQELTSTPAATAAKRAWEEGQEAKELAREAGADQKTLNELQNQQWADHEPRQQAWWKEVTTPTHTVTIEE